jgi:hypothetical protein
MIDHNSITDVHPSGKWDRLQRIPFGPESSGIVIKKSRRGEATELALFYFTVTPPAVAPTAGAVYTHNGVSFVVVSYAAGVLKATSLGGPLTSGTLTKSSGTGSATITFTSFTEPNPIKALIWQPLEQTGRFWARHWFGSNPGGTDYSCCARILRTTFSELYPRVNSTPPNTGVGQVVNRDTGAQAQVASVIIEANAASGRVESGSGWANYSSGSQVPVTRYVLTASASNSVTYTITGVSRIHWRFFQASNGGKIAVSITTGGSPISASQYLVGPQTGSRQVAQWYLSSAFNATRFGHAPLAKGLNPASTYAVTLTWSSGYGGRIYDSGLIGFVDATNDRDGFPYNQVGVFGLWDRYTSFTNMQACLFGGSRAVYLTSACTRIDWNFGRRTGACFAGIKIYNSSGTEISSGSYRNTTVHANGDRYIDTYGASTSQASLTIAEGLPSGTYYVHIWALPDRSVAFTETASGSYLGSQWAIYDGGLSTYNTDVGGTPGTDAFIDSIKQFCGGGSDPVDAAGNFVFAGQVRDTGDAVFNSLSEVGYVSATHGAETYPESISILIDGVSVDWASQPDGTQWLADEILISFGTRIGTQANPTSYWANAIYSYAFNRFGVTTSFSLQTTRQVQRGFWFLNMNIAPNATATNGTLLGSGFSKLYIEPNVTLETASSGSGTSNYSTRPHRGTAFLTPEGHCVAIEHMNEGEIWSQWSSGENATLNTERLRTSKTYAVAFNDPTSGGNGVTLNSGFEISGKQVMRLFFDQSTSSVFP